MGVPTSRGLYFQRLLSQGKAIKSVQCSRIEKKGNLLIDILGIGKVVHQKEVSKMSIIIVGGYEKLLSIHDCEILSYEVDFQKSIITLHVVNGDRDSVIIEFIDVLTHMFETQFQGSIILDISTQEVSRFFENNQELLEKQKNYGWPMHYDTTEQLFEYLQSKEYNYYVISASYGLNGWVIAKDYKICN